MAECDWAILCDYAFLDVGRKMCMIGVFDRVFTASVPSALHHSAVAIKLIGEPGEEINFRVEIIRPTGGQLATMEGTASVPEVGAVEMTVTIAGMPLPDFGLYSLNIHAGTALLKTVGFLVTQPAQTQPSQTR